MQRKNQTNLGNLGFQLIPPSRPLSPYVRSYWYFQCDTPLLTPQDEYMHPLGRFGIGFNFGDPLLLDSQPLIEPVFLDGTNTISRKMSFFGQVEVFGVSFHEGSAFSILGVPLIELQNSLSLLNVWNGKDLLNLYARLREAKSLSLRIHLLEDWLLSRLSQGRELDQLVLASLGRLQAGKGQLPIPQLSEQFSISQRQLERLYQNQVGVSPKQYARLLKVEAARLALRRTNKNSSVDLALELGFYDQPHFIREFSSVIGLTPYAYMNRKRQ
jgi:AraC-like DNA-binding protein